MLLLGARYLRPALEDDSLLLSLEELLLQGSDDNADENADDGDGDGAPSAGSSGGPATGVEEEKGGASNPSATTAETKSAGDDSTATAGAGISSMSLGVAADGTGSGSTAAPARSRVEELERENVALREALQEADARMARANRVLRSLAGGATEDGKGVCGGGGAAGESDDEDGEGSVAGVSVQTVFGPGVL